MQARDGSGMRESPLAFIFEGMKVYDLEGEELGTVDHLYIGSVPPEEAREPEPETTDEPDMAREGLWDAFEDVFDPVDQLEEDMRVSLWQSGFMRVKGQKLSGEQRYITPDRIAGVSDGKVHLTVPLDELVRR